MNGCTEAVLAAVRRELEQRRTHIDGSEDVGAITLTVKLNAGTTWVRGVTYTEERVYRNNPARRAT